MRLASIILVYVFLTAAHAYAATHEEIRKELKAQYGVEPKRWLGWADEEREQSLVQLFQKAGKSHDGLTGSMLYTLAIGEGLSEWIDAHYTRDGKGIKLDTEVDGFDYLGTDHFSSDLARLRSGKFISDDFNKGDEFTITERKNEQGMKVRSANFKNLESAITAFAATIAHRRSLVLDHRKRDLPNEPELDADRLFFWTYAYYIDGEGDGRKHLKETKSDYTTSTRLEIKNKALERLATWHYVRRFVKSFAD